MVHSPAACRVAGRMCSRCRAKQCVWLRFTARLLPQPDRVRRARLFERETSQWKIIKPGQKWADGEVRLENCVQCSAHCAQPAVCALDSVQGDVCSYVRAVCRFVGNVPYRAHNRSSILCWPHAPQVIFTPSDTSSVLIPAASRREHRDSGALEREFACRLSRQWSSRPSQQRSSQHCFRPRRCAARPLADLRHARIAYMCLVAAAHADSDAQKCTAWHRARVLRVSKPLCHRGDRAACAMDRPSEHPGGIGRGQMGVGATRPVPVTERPRSQIEEGREHGRQEEQGRRGARCHGQKEKGQCPTARWHMTSARGLHPAA